MMKMLVFESLGYVILTLLMAFPVSIAAVAFGVRLYLNYGQDWISVFTFSIAPLVASVPLLIVVAVIIPYICYYFMDQNGVRNF